MKRVLNILEKMNVSYQLGLGEFGVDYGEEPIPQLIVVFSPSNLRCGMGNYLDNKDQLKFSDEYFICPECQRVCTRGEYQVVRDEASCNNCIKTEPEEYFEHISNDGSKANTISTKEELARYGWELVAKDFLTGLHEGMDTNPEENLKPYIKQGDNQEFIYHVDSHNPFMIDYSI